MTKDHAVELVKGFQGAINQADLTITLASMAFGVVVKDVCEALGVSSADFGKKMLKPSGDLIEALNRYKSAISTLVTEEEWPEEVIDDPR